jgi:phage tail sheath gpL-like
MTISTAVDPSAVASVLGISVAYQNFGTGSAVRLPQIGYVVGQGNEAASYASAKFQASSAVDVGNRVGFGSPLHLSAVELFPADGDGLGTIPAWFYPLQAHGSGIAAVFDFTPSGAGTATATLRLRVGGILSCRRPLLRRRLSRS